MGTYKCGCSRWMVLLWCSSRSQGCKSLLFSCFEPHVCLSQVPIITKADCMKNMEENGLGFIEGVLCAGGNTNGTCQVWKEDLFGEKDKINFDKEYIQPMYQNPQGDSGGALTTEDGMLVGLVSAAGSDQCGKVMFQYLSSLLKRFERFEINFPFVNFKTTFTGKCLRPLYRDCCLYDLDQRNYIEDGRHAGLRSCVWGDKPRGSVFSRSLGPKKIVSCHFDQIVLLPKVAAK